MQFEPISLGYNSFTLNYELNGCSVEDSIDIFVNPIPLVNVFGDAICAGDTALIGASAIPSGGDLFGIDGSSSVGYWRHFSFSLQPIPHNTMYNTHPYKGAQMIRQRLLYMHLKFL